MTVSVALAGAGAFGAKHIDAMRNIDGVEVVAVVGRELDRTASSRRPTTASTTSTTDLADVLAIDAIDAVVLATPTALHAEQSIATMRAGKHVQVEIPLCDNLADGEAVVAVQQETGLVAMCGHTRRFNPSHQWMHERIRAGDYAIQQMDVQTYFFRRTNTNALGQPRSWTDHLLWHHAAHTVDLFAYQTGSRIVAAHALQGPTASRTRHRHGHVDPAGDRQRRHLHPVAVVQQRRSVRHDLPVHRRHGDVCRELRRPRRPGTANRSTCPAWRCR